MLIIFEMANNHMGSLEHGKKIIDEFSKVKDKFPQFEYAFKFQMRDLSTYIHPSADPENKYVKRFRETDLGYAGINHLAGYAQGHGFKVGCTPFDERSVEVMTYNHWDFLKVGSPMATDWSLLHYIGWKWDDDIIASVGGLDEDGIDYLISRICLCKSYTLLHCVSEYPTKPENLQLNQIDWLKKKYPGIPIGFSYHGDSFIYVQAAIYKGAEVIERHVCIEPKPNNYSLTPTEMDLELNMIEGAIRWAGEKGVRVPGPKPIQFMRQNIDGKMAWKP